MLRDGPQRRVTVGRLDDVVALVRQELAEQRQVRGLVVHGEDQRPLAVHGSRLSDGVGERREVDRLAQVPVEPGRERPIPVADHGVGGEGDDAQAGDGAVDRARSSLSACQPSMSGQPEIHEHQVGQRARAPVRCRPSAVSADSTSWPAAREQLGGQGAVRRGVLDQQDGRH